MAHILVLQEANEEGIPIMSFPVSLVIPHKIGDPLNIPEYDLNDELLVIEGLGAGEARIKGAQLAKNDWLLQLDGDGIYPNYYVALAKEIIASGLYPEGFKARRLGGFASGAGQEAGMVVRRDVFLERTADLDPIGRVDVGPLFSDLPINEDLIYYHPLTFGEGQIVTSLFCGLTGLLVLAVVK